MSVNFSIFVLCLLCLVASEIYGGGRGLVALKHVSPEFVAYSLDVELRTSFDSRASRPERSLCANH
jgi:hypothetical protein